MSLSDLLRDARGGGGLDDLLREAKGEEEETPWERRLRRLRDVARLNPTFLFAEEGYDRMKGVFEDEDRGSPALLAGREALGTVPGVIDTAASLDKHPMVKGLPGLGETFGIQPVLDWAKGVQDRTSELGARVSRDYGRSGRIAATVTGMAADPTNWISGKAVVGGLKRAAADPFAIMGHRAAPLADDAAEALAKGAAPSLRSVDAPASLLDELPVPEDVIPPRIATRVDTEAGARALTKKPQGTYVSLGDNDVYQGYGFGDVKSTAEVRPKNILRLDNSDDISAGTALLKKFHGEEGANAIMRKSAEELEAEIAAKFPNADLSGVRQKWDLFDIYGAEEARARGIDYVEVFNKHAPSHSEGVILDDAIANWKGGAPESLLGNGKSPRDPFGARPAGTSRAFFDEAPTGRMVDLPVSAGPKDDWQHTMRSVDLPPDDQQVLIDMVMERPDLVEKFAVGQEISHAALGQDPDLLFRLAGKTGGSMAELSKRVANRTLDTRGAMLLDASLQASALEARDIAADLALGRLTGDAATQASMRLADLQVKNLTAQAALLGNASEVGRALQARKMRVRSMAGTPDQWKLDMLQSYKLDEKQIAALAKLDNNPESVLHFLRQVHEPKARDFLMANYYSSLLYSGASQLRNIVGNVGELATSLVVRPIAAVGSEIASKITGKAPSVTMESVLVGQRAAAMGAQQGLDKALHILQHGTPPDLLSKFSMPRDPFLLHPNETVRNLGKFITAPLRGLQAADAFFSAISFTSRQYEAAARVARATGDDVVKLLDNPDILAEATEFARRNTYTDDPSKLASMILGFQKSGGVGGTTATFVAPFVRIADRMTARAGEFMVPVALGKEVAKAAAGKRADVADRVARLAIGWGAGLFAYKAAMDGKLTGAAPIDSAKKTQFYESGKKPFSVLIDGEWVPFSQIGSLGFVLGAAAQAAEYSKATKAKENPGEILANAAYGAIDYVLETSFMEGLQLVSKTIQTQEPGTDLGGRLKPLGRFATNTLAAQVPASALTRSMSQAMDPTIRQQKPWSTLDAVKGNLPIASESLPARVDYLGRDMQRDETGLGAFVPRDTALSVASGTNRGPNPLDVEFQAIGFAPGMVEKKLAYSGLSVDLTDAEQRELQRVVGAELQKLGTKLLGMPGYRKLDPEQRKEFVERYYAKAREQAKMRFLKDNDDVRARLLAVAQIGR